jgi:NADPH-dependent 7-cyano-7-deazaguanine reductase QueF-like protein
MLATIIYTPMQASTLQYQQEYKEAYDITNLQALERKRTPKSSISYL